MRDAVDICIMQYVCYTHWSSFLLPKHLYRFTLRECKVVTRNSKNDLCLPSSLLVQIFVLYQIFTFTHKKNTIAYHFRIGNGFKTTPTTKKKQHCVSALHFSIGLTKMEIKLLAFNFCARFDIDKLMKYILTQVVCHHNDGQLTEWMNEKNVDGVTAVHCCYCGCCCFWCLVKSCKELSIESWFNSIFFFLLTSNVLICQE